jgi:hypothetical protein
MLKLSVAHEVSLRNASLEGRRSGRLGLRPAHFVLTARRAYGQPSLRRHGQLLRWVCVEQVGCWGGTGQATRSNWAATDTFRKVERVLYKSPFPCMCFVWTDIYFSVHWTRTDKIVSFVNSGEKCYYVLFRAMDYCEMNRICLQRYNEISNYNCHRSVM